jgi:hypothetical protein
MKIPERNNAERRASGLWKTQDCTATGVNFEVNPSGVIGYL